jgi:hypothetical protein
LRKSIPYVLFLLGVVLLGAAVFYVWHTAPAPTGAGAEVPLTISGFSLTQKQTGAAALASVKQLHVSDFPAVAAVTASYGQQSATLWVVEADSEGQALELATSMEQSIANGGTPFTPVGVFQFSGRDVYMLDGLGQSHFYFKSGKNIIWLAVNAAAAEQALKELLAFYP